MAVRAAEYRTRVGNGSGRAFPSFHVAVWVLPKSPMDSGPIHLILTRPHFPVRYITSAIQEISAHQSSA
jgi:hypothetical protein